MAGSFIKELIVRGDVQRCPIISPGSLGDFYSYGAVKEEPLTAAFGYGWRVFDIATFFNNQLNQVGYSTQTRALLEVFLDGYQSIRRLSATEIAVLPAFVALRQIWLWGISMNNRPMVGFGLFEQWMREISLPTLRAWVDDEL